MANFNERLKELRKSMGWSQDELADKLGTTRSCIGNYEQGSRKPDIESLEQIADLFNVDMAYLTGSQNTRKIISFDNAHYKKGIKIPILGRVIAGIPVEAVEEIIGYEEITEEMAEQGDYFALRIKGDSMSPRILENDVVIVRKQTDADNGDLVIALVNGHEATCKKLIKHTHGITLQSFNTNYEPMFFSEEEIKELPVQIIGRVVELRGKF